MTSLCIAPEPSQHAAIKGYINSSQGDLLTTWLSIQQAVANQISTLCNNSAKDRIRTPLNLTRSVFQACFGHITIIALQKAYSNFASAERPLKPCTGKLGILLLYQYYANIV